MSTVYFTDRDLGRQFPATLRAAGITVEEHIEHFAPATADEAWLGTVGTHRWIAITHDKRIHYKVNERDAVMRSGVALLVVIGSAPFRELANNFVRTIGRIELFVRANQPPWIAKVMRPHPSESRRNSDAVGRVDMWLSHEQWLMLPR